MTAPPCHPEGLQPLPTGRQAKDPMAFSNNQQSLLWMGFFASLRMTTESRALLCHPEGLSPKDPTAFSNNQQFLLCRGFFASLRMTTEKTLR